MGKGEEGEKESLEMQSMDNQKNKRGSRSNVLIMTAGNVRLGPVQGHETGCCDERERHLGTVKRTSGLSAMPRRNPVELKKELTGKSTREGRKERMFRSMSSGSWGNSIQNKQFQERGESGGVRGPTNWKGRTVPSNSGLVQGIKKKKIRKKVKRHRLRKDVWLTARS